MRKIIYTLGLLLGTSSATAQTLVTEASALTDGTVISLECRDTNGGDGWSFNLNAVKSENLSYNNLFVVEAAGENENGGVKLKRLSDNVYVGKSGTANGSTVTAVTDAAQAAVFTLDDNLQDGTTDAAGIINNWSTKREETLTANCIRFITENNIFLNTQAKAGIPKYTSGYGGHSAWYVYSYTQEEINALKPAEYVFPVKLSTDTEKHYYTINSYNRGGVLTIAAQGAALTHEAAGLGSYWYFTQGTGENSAQIHNVSNDQQLGQNRTLTETATTWYFPQHAKQAEVTTAALYSISKTAELASGSCIDANNNGAGTGFYCPVETDWQGTSWSFTEVTFDNIKNALQEASSAYATVSTGISEPGVQQEDLTAFNNAINAITAGSSFAAAYTALNTLISNSNWPVFTIENCNPSYGVGKGMIDDTNGGDQHFKTIGQVDDRMLWTVKQLSAKTMSVGSYDIVNYSTGRHIRNNSSTVNVTLTSDHPEGTEGQFLVKLGNDVVHAQNSGSVLVIWNNTTTANSASAWKFHYVGTAAELAGEPYTATFNKVHAVVDQINAATPYTSLLGADYGQYSGSTTAEWTAMINNAQATIEKNFDNFDATAAENAASMITTQLGNLDLNVPKEGDLLRVKSVREGNYYLGSQNSTVDGKTSRAAYVTGKEDDNEATTIFLYTNNKLLNLSTGYYLNNNSSFLGYNNITDGTSVSFHQESPTLSRFFIKFNGNRYLYTHNDRYTDAGSSTNNDAGYRFILEKVSSLPVKVTAAGYGTLYTPAALTIPAEVKAYAAVINEATGEADLTKVTGTVPANTGLVLEGEGNYSFAVAAEGGIAPKANDLTGSVATTDYASDDSDIFILAMPAGKEAGFYLMNNDDRIIKGGKAFLQKSGAQANAYIFNFGETTGIGSVEQQENGKDVIYDLSGRRVTKAQRGLYIVNGRKVLVK